MAERKLDLPKPRFAPVPARAMSDSRLAAAHHRVLQAIADHHRLGVNGVGCTASHRRLADITGLHFTTVTKKIADLILYGYVVAKKSGKDGRRRIYHVVYNDEDAAVSDGAPTLRQYRTATNSVADNSAIGGENFDNDGDRAKLVGRKVTVSHGDPSGSGDAIYSLKGNNLKKINSPKGKYTHTEKEKNNADLNEPFNMVDSALEGENRINGPDPTIHKNEVDGLVKRATRIRSLKSRYATEEINRAIDTASDVAEFKSQNPITEKPKARKLDAKPSQALLDSRLSKTARGEK